MRKTKYKGIVDPSTKKIKRLKPGQKADAVEQLVFNENLELREMELPDIEPAYVKKYLKSKS